MSHRSELAVWVGLACLALVAPTALADYYDSFDDGWWERDPNDPAFDANDPYWTDPNNAVHFDVDNPDWTIYDSLWGSTHVANMGSDSVAEKALRLAVSGFELFDFVIGINFAGVDDWGVDPNTSPTWFVDDTNHYVLAWIYYPSYYDPNVSSGYNDPNYDPNLDDPNDDKGHFSMIMHADVLAWHAFQFEMMFYNMAGGAWPEQWHHTYYGLISSQNADYLFEKYNTPGYNFRRIWIEPEGIRVDPVTGLPDYTSTTRDPNDTAFLKPQESLSQDAYVRDPNYDTTEYLGLDFDSWERQGFWALFQFEVDPNSAAGSGDPNGKWLKAASWSGDKYDWNGNWLQSGELSTRYASGAGSTVQTDWYWAEGCFGIGVQSDPCYGGGFPAAVVFDNVEVRTGVFDPDAKHLDLQIKNSKYGQVEIDPDLADPNDPYDPNLVDPNDGLTFPQERLLRYTTGTEVVLVAEALPDRSFKSWTIYDPNYPGDGNYSVVDTNAVIYLTMDADYEVEALFNCGSGVPPFVAMTLLALGLGVVIRRLV